MNDVREIWIETSQVALSIVEDPRVSAGWSDASSLPMMTIGSVVGHLLHSGILLGTLTAVALNWYFNGLASADRARHDVAAAAQGAEA